MTGQPVIRPYRGPRERRSVRSHDLPATSFPFTIELFDSVTGEVRWTAEITGAGTVGVPGKNEVNDGRALACRITNNKGEVVVLVGEAENDPH